MGRLNKVPEMTMPYTATVREDQRFKEIPRKHHTLHGQKIRFERKKNENIPSATNSNQKGKKTIILRIKYLVSHSYYRTLLT